VFVLFVANVPNVFSVYLAPFSLTVPSQKPKLGYVEIKKYKFMLAANRFGVNMTISAPFCFLLADA
jgi:hypothetical protein